jgi:hypothetical protein
MTVAVTYTGGCHCGGVRFECYGEMREALVCHCYDCMKTVGNSIVATASHLNDITITETTLKWYASSSFAKRGFCCGCGASLFYKLDAEDHISIAIGMLDDSTGIGCRGQIFAHAHPGYMDVPKEIPHIDDVFNSNRNT